MVLLLLSLALALSASVTGDKGFLITGGSEHPTSVELFLPKSGQACLLPQILGVRKDHSQCGSVVCGGADFYARDDCIQMDESGEWSTLGFTVEHRTDHVCWDMADGTMMLLGGDYDEQSTEVFNTELGSGETGFRLQYPSRGACVIEDSTTDTAIVSAGVQVARYTAGGWVEDLPILQQNRNWHGCGQYQTDSGNYIYLVAGGWDMANWSFLDSVEMLTYGNSAWEFSTPLPRAMSNMGSVTLDNKIFIVGGGNRDGQHSDGRALTPHSEVLQWEPMSNEWIKIGDMFQARSSHAMSTIDANEELCLNRK